MAWTIRADFEGFIDGVQAEGDGGFHDTTNDLAIRLDNKAYSGNMAALLDIKANTSGYGTWGGTFTFPEKLGKGDEIWYRVSVNIPSGFDYDADPWLKFMRIHTPDGHLDWYITNEGSKYPFQFIYEGEQVWSKFGTDNDRVQFDRWETYEMYIKLDNVSVDNGGESLVRVWKNGRLMGEFTDRQTLKSTTTKAGYALLFTYWNGENSPSQSLMVDDIIITTDTPTKTDVNGNPFVGVGSTRRPKTMPVRIQ